MSRIGEDYIWLAKPTRKKPTLRWLGFALAIPLVAGAVSLSGLNDTEKHAKSAGEIISPVSAANASVGELQLSEPHPQTLENTARDTLRLSPVALSATSTTPSADVQQADQQSNNDPADSAVTADEQWLEVGIQRGDTLSLAFERHNLSYKDSLAIAHLPEHGSRFTRGLKSGDVMQVRADDNGQVLALKFPLDQIRTLTLERDGKSFDAEIIEEAVEHRTAYAVGTIDTSFYVDALEAGLSDNLIMNLAHIYGWDLDFVLDVRAGDQFIVVYDQLFRDGEKIRDGKILAAEFQNRGRTMRALRYTTEDGTSAYYSPEGRQMKKAFIRTPLDQFRISSHFSLGRKHPILNRIRKHSGTDYAAPSGTPIKAAGNGRIAYRGRKGGYGNLIEIRHNRRISTRYGHMQRFASGLGVGSHVRQGQIIGYVGMSGLATGPHLHYEFRENGVARNPETVALPKANPIPKKYLDDFKRKSAPLLAQIEALDRIQVASNGQLD